MLLFLSRDSKDPVLAERESSKKGEPLLDVGASLYLLGNRMGPIATAPASATSGPGS